MSMAKLKEIEKLQYELNLLDNKRFEMEKRFGFDPKDFLYEGKILNRKEG